MKNKLLAAGWSFCLYIRVFFPVIQAEGGALALRLKTDPEFRAESDVSGIVSQYKKFADDALDT